MKTVKQRNMMKRELKLAIGDQLQTLSHPIVNTTKHSAGETRKELEPMKKTLADIDGALNRPLAGPGPRVKNVDTTFGIFRRQDGQLQMGSEIVKISENGTILDVDGVEYDLTSGLHTLIVQKHPRPNQWTSGDYHAYKYLSIQTKVGSHPNPRGVARPRSTWKYKHMLRKMIVPGDSIVDEESEDSEDSAAGESTDSSSPPIKPGLFTKSTSEPPSPAHTRSDGKARKTKDREAFYKGWKGDGVVYLPGDINGLAKKLQLLAAELGALYWAHCLD